METILHQVVLFATTYQLLFITGIIGASAYRLFNMMSKIMFVKHLLVSIFVSSLICLVIKNFTDWSNDMIFVGGSIGGYFSSALINEGKEIIDGLSDIVKEKLGQKSKDDENGES